MRLYSVLTPLEVEQVFVPSYPTNPWYQNTINNYKHFLL